MTSRIHRASHRIGVVLAGSASLIALGLAGREAWWEWRDGQQLASGVDRDHAVLLAAPMPFPHVADFTGAEIALAAAPALYAAARAVGWVLEGFARPDHST